jgi:hypothetical protein
MFSFLARRIPRFNFWTLLLAISVGGAARYGLGPEYETAAALRALEQEGIGYVVMRPSGKPANSASLSAVAWNPITRLGNWIGGYPDRTGGIDVQAWPSEAAREKLFDLPYLEYLSITPSADRSRTDGPERIPTPEEILGRALPESSGAVDLAPEPPPVPRGVPLSDEERDEAIAAMTKAWSSPPTFLRERYLCRADSTDFPGTTRLTASEVNSTWQLRYEQMGSFASAKTELRTKDIATDQVWSDGGWRTYPARRNLTAAHLLADPSLGLAWPSNYLAWARSIWLQGEPALVYESVERLDDGSLALRLRPREIPDLSIPKWTFELFDGLLIVDPNDDFAIRRFEMVEADRSGNGSRTSFCYLFGYEEIAGHAVPVRCSSWTDIPRHTIDGVSIPGGPRSSVARYAWEFDPELPPSLFEPPSGKGSFFTAVPSTEIHWWYVTGGLSLGWLYFVATNGIRQRLQRKKSKARSSSRTTDGIAESEGGS